MTTKNVRPKDKEADFIAIRAAFPTGSLIA